MNFNFKPPKIFREVPPTAGLPFHLHDFFHRENAPHTFAQHFKSYLALSGEVIFTCSGTVALYLILETIKESTHKRTLVLPSFICPLVALAVHHAGFRFRVCDIEKDSFNYNWQQLESVCGEENDLAAILVCHLAGQPLQMNRLLDYKQRFKILLIEDVAQALGAKYEGKYVGSFGDFSFYSFSCGKGISTYEGGAASAQNLSLASMLIEKEKSLVSSNLVLESLRILQLIGLAITYRPSLFWFVYRAPQLFWQWRGDPLKAAMEDFSIDFPIHRPSKWRMSVAESMLLRLENELQEQRKRAEFYRNELQEDKGLTLINAHDDEKKSLSSEPFIPLIFHSAKRRELVWNQLRTQGTGVSEIYLHSLVDYPYLQNIPSLHALHPEQSYHAREFIKRGMTLTTNAFITEEEMLRVITTIKKAR